MCRWFIFVKVGFSLDSCIANDYAVRDYAVLVMVLAVLVCGR
jgi:hypothetical protein